MVRCQLSEISMCRGKMKINDSQARPCVLPPWPRWAVQKKIVLVSGDGGGGGARVYWPQTEFLACPAAHRAYFRDLRQAGERRSCRGRLRTIPLRWAGLLHDRPTSSLWK